MKLPLKLAIFVLILFALVVTAMLLWKPVKVKYYTSKLQSDNIKVRQAYAKKLLEMGAREPVFRFYSDRYDPKSVERRMDVVDELCEVGDRGKEVMKEIFRNWCYSQQVRIPAGTLTFSNGCKVEINALYFDKFEVTREKYEVFFKCFELHKEFCLDLATGKKIYAKLPDTVSMQHPITEVSWEKAKAFADWIGMRLPTEYEWEYAARGKKVIRDIRAPCSSELRDKDFLDEHAWYKKNSGEAPHPVGQKRPTSRGLFDMHGNVSEYYHCKDIKTPLYKGGSYRSERGGFHCPGKLLQFGDSLSFVGFRCVRD